MKHVHKILVVSTNSSLNSGASRSLITFVSILQKERTDFQFQVVIPMHGDMEDLMRKNGIRYRVILHSNKMWSKEIGAERRIDFVRLAINWVAKIRFALLLKNIDLVHINALTTGLAAEVAYKEKKKVIWHFREFMEEDLGREFVNPAMALSLIDKADERIAISKSAAHKYQGLLKNKIRIIYNGLPEEEYYCQRDILQRQTVRILLPGRITPQKGQKTLLEALQKLQERGVKNLSAVIIGSGERKYIEDLKKYIQEHSLSVDILPPSNAISQFYKQTDVVCVCSHCEAFGRVTVEGMMMGCVVIGSKSGANMELIEEGKSGFLYERDNPTSLADKIEYVLNHRELAKKVALEGQKKAVETFTAKKNADEICKVYEKVLGNCK